MNILISSAGRRVSLVKAFKKELAKLYPEAKIIASDSNPELSAACNAADSYFKVPRVADKDYVKELINKCVEHKVRLLIPTIDTELAILAQEKEQFLANNIIPVISDNDLISKCRDKRLIHEFFTANKIAVAKEYSKQNYTLPMFLKPWDGSRSIDTFLIKKESDLNEYHLNHEKLMFLEYLNHDHYDEYTCDLYYGKDNFLKCVVPRKRLSVRDGEVNKGLTERNSLIDYIKNRLNFVEGAVGCLTVQFFKHKTLDKVYGIEINPRFGGGYPLSYLAGANFPKWIIEEYLLEKKLTEKFDSWESNLLMIRYDAEILVHDYKS